MDFPAKADCDVIGEPYHDVQMMQAILVDDTYVNPKGLMWVSSANDIGGFR